MNRSISTSPDHAIQGYVVKKLEEYRSSSQPSKINDYSEVVSSFSENEKDALLFVLLNHLTSPRTGKFFKSPLVDTKGMTFESTVVVENIDENRVPNTFVSSLIDNIYSTIERVSGSKSKFYTYDLLYFAPHVFEEFRSYVHENKKKELIDLISRTYLGKFTHHRIIENSEKNERIDWLSYIFKHAKIDMIEAVLHRFSQHQAQHKKFFEQILVPSNNHPDGASSSEDFSLSLLFYKTQRTEVITLVLDFIQQHYFQEEEEEEEEEGNQQTDDDDDDDDENKSTSPPCIGYEEEKNGMVMNILRPFRKLSLTEDEQKNVDMLLQKSILVQNNFLLDAIVVMGASFLWEESSFQQQDLEGGGGGEEECFSSKSRRWSVLSFAAKNGKFFALKHLLEKYPSDFNSEKDLLLTFHHCLVKYISLQRKTKKKNMMKKKQKKKKTSENQDNNNNELELIVPPENILEIMYVLLSKKRHLIDIDLPFTKSPISGLKFLTPLNFSVIVKSLELVKFLLQWKARPDVLSLDIRDGNLDVIRMINNNNSSQEVQCGRVLGYKEEDQDEDEEEGEGEEEEKVEGIWKHSLLFTLELEDEQFCLSMLRTILNNENWNISIITERNDWVVKRSRLGIIEGKKIGLLKKGSKSEEEEKDEEEEEISVFVPSCLLWTILHSNLDCFRIFISEHPELTKKLDPKTKRHILHHLCFFSDKKQKDDYTNENTKSQNTTKSTTRRSCPSLPIPKCEIGIVLPSLLKNCEPEFINSADYEGNTPLHLAVEKGNCTMISHLLRCKANFTLRNKSGRISFEMSDETDIKSYFTYEQQRLQWEMIQSIQNKLEEVDSTSVEEDKRWDDLEILKKEVKNLQKKNQSLSMENKSLMRRMSKSSFSAERQISRFNQQQQQQIQQQQIQQQIQISSSLPSLPLRQVNMKQQIVTTSPGRVNNNNNNNNDSYVWKCKKICNLFVKKEAVTSPTFISKNQQFFAKLKPGQVVEKQQKFKKKEKKKNDDDNKNQIIGTSFNNNNNNNDNSIQIINFYLYLKDGEYDVFSYGVEFEVTLMNEFENEVWERKKISTTFRKLQGHGFRFQLQIYDLKKNSSSNNNSSCSSSSDDDEDNNNDLSLLGEKNSYNLMLKNQRKKKKKKESRRKRRRRSGGKKMRSKFKGWYDNMNKVGDEYNSSSSNDDVDDESDGDEEERKMDSWKDFVMSIQISVLKLDKFLK